MLVEKLDEMINRFGYFAENSKTLKVYSLQKGSFRTNCFDCLDRTNVVQTRIAFRALELQVIYTIKC